MRSWLCLLLVLAVTSCSSDIDGDPATAPEITDVQFRSQTGDNGESFNFLISFRDSDGNLAGGILTFKAGDEEPASLPLQTLFDNQDPPLATETVEGQLEVTLRYQPAGGISSGERLSFAFTLVDAAKQSSETKSLTLLAVTGGN